MAITLTVAHAAAQSRAAGKIRATVLDASGAAVPGVAITFQNQLTGIITRIKSNDAGVFDFASVDPGIYTVKFEKEGFKQFVESDIVPNVEAITINATLEVARRTNRLK